MNKRTQYIIGGLIWSLAIFYYFFEFFLRVFLGTIASDLMSSLKITPEQFSLIGSAYYITYSALQMPVGIMVDRFGARRLLTIACGVCTVGVFWLASAQSFLPALFSRFLIGFGSAFAFVSLLVIALNWFPQKHFGFLSGVAQFLGAVGPMVAGAPLVYILSLVNNNWRFITICLGFFGLVLTLLIGFFLRNKPKREEKKLVYLQPNIPIYTQLGQLLKINQIWWIILYAGCIYVSMPLLGAFWGTSYLKARGYPLMNAAFIISMIWLGMAISCPLFGKISDTIHRRKPALIIVAIIGLIFSSLILFSPIKNYYAVLFMFLFFGFAAGGQSLSFAVISEYVPLDLKGTAMGINNTMIMLFGALVPPIVTSYMQSLSGGSGTFTIVDFEIGLSIMPILYLVALLIAVFGIKETYCHQQNEVYKIEVNE